MSKSINYSRMSKLRQIIREEIKRALNEQEEGFINFTPETFDPDKIDDYQFHGVDTRDYPDFSDAYLTDVYYDGKEVTEEELEYIEEEHPDWVYDKLMDWLR